MSWISDLLHVIRPARVMQKKLTTSEVKREKLERKVTEMETQERAYQAKLTSLQQKHLQLKEELQELIGTELDATDIAILLALSEYRDLGSGDLEELLRLSHTTVEFHLYKLVVNSYISSSHSVCRTYMLNQRGSRFLQEIACRDSAVGLA